MAAADDAAPATWELLDVLEQLPRDVLRKSIWLHLTADDRWCCGNLGLPPPNRDVHGRAFRLVCRRTRDLADQLLRRLALTHDHRTCARRKWPDAVLRSQQGAFLARQEQLHLLVVDDESSFAGPAFLGTAAVARFESNLITTLQLGGAACRNLPALHLRSCGYTAASGAAVRRCCPNLRQLDMEVGPIEAAFFAPDDDGEWCCLREVTLRSNSESGLFDAALLQSLATLPTLRSLTLEGRLDSTHADLLAHLTSLSELCMDALSVCGPREEGASRLGSALACMSHLSRLEVPRWDDRPPHSNCSQVLNAVVTHLSRHTNLCALSFGGSPDEDCDLVLDDDDGFRTLRRLPGLTRLSCCTISRQMPPGTVPVLPLLQLLRFRGRLSCPDLAATLQALLPLRELRDFECVVSFRPDTIAGDGPAIDASASATAAAAVLARLPRLQRINLTLDNSCPPADSPTLAGLIPVLLPPLCGRLTTLRLDYLSAELFEEAWPVLRLATCLERLAIRNCHVSEDGLLQCVGRSLPSLRHLLVWECHGVSGSSAVALAQLRVQPLYVAWAEEEDLDIAVRLEFRAVASPGVSINTGSYDF